MSTTHAMLARYQEQLVAIKDLESQLENFAGVSPSHLVILDFLNKKAHEVRKDEVKQTCLPSPVIHRSLGTLCKQNLVTKESGGFRISEKGRDTLIGALARITILDALDS